MKIRWARRFAVFSLVVLINKIGACEEHSLWRKVGTVLKSDSWNGNEEYLVKQAFTLSDDNSLKRLCSSTDTSIAIRAYFDQARRMATQKASLSFIENCEKRLQVSFPHWLKTAVSNGSFEGTTFFPDLEGIVPYSPSPTHKIGNDLQVEIDVNSRTLSITSLKGERVVVSNVDFPMVNGCLTGGASAGRLVIAIHSQYADPFEIVCIDIKQMEVCWRATCRDGDNIKFYSGPSSMFVSVHVVDQHVAVCGISNGVLFLEIRETENGLLVGRFSSLL
ncbi:hypothetical protein [Thalassoglobus sp.]|uniref:hypothetical protein n=1 Tax=Thalassoglobus sp. TaxID=2795869 RepID=UPI003AA805E9